ncbi:unnamed protein product [Miscanthus lutarioriparius]|uniref:C2H2-type domain-containing protein n=1 Tax=Miscanthus lutarioriparius TaxID=422564 RepID=A0A811M7R6_9POAL|nr:unnamed protein product [Miscanthus lutarioriparius]
MNSKEMCQEPCDELSEISSQEASNSSGLVSLDLSLTVAVAAAAAAESSTTDNSNSNSNSGSVQADAAVAAREPSRVFTCNYCQRKFFSSQALGGHQNAHRRERTLARRALRLDATGPYGYYADVASLPLYGSGLYPIGIQAHASTAAHSEQQRHEDGAAAELRRPARGLLSPMPFLVADEEMSFGWPGSFRPAAAAAAAAPAGSAALNSAGGVAVHARDEPDLTLRL